MNTNIHGRSFPNLNSSWVGSNSLTAMSNASRLAKLIKLKLQYPDEDHIQMVEFLADSDIHATESALFTSVDKPEVLTISKLLIPCMQ